MTFYPFDNGIVVRNEDGLMIAHIIKPRPVIGKIPRGTWWVEYTEYVTSGDMLIIEEVVREHKFTFFKGCKKLVDKTNPKGYHLFFY